MITNLTKENLIGFENWVIQTYKDGKLRSPVHLSGGNEEQLIEIFKEIKPQDWVFTTYRSHYHALLKGVPEQRLKDWILANKSIHFMDSEHKVFSSAIVGGCLPIALGVAMSIKDRCKEVERGVRSAFNSSDITIGKISVTPTQKVYCFVGDMTASLGVFSDCLNYAIEHDLPIKFIVENNTFSTDTKTAEVWNKSQRDMDIWLEGFKYNSKDKVLYYKYERTHPHYGIGEFIEFKDEQLVQDGKNF